MCCTSNRAPKARRARATRPETRVQLSDCYTYTCDQWIVGHLRLTLGKPMKNIDPAIWEGISFITACSVLMLLLFAPVGANAAVVQYTTPILGITTSANGFNGCMVKVEPVPQTVYCTNRSNHTFLSLDCSGQWVAKGDAANNLKLAQIALLTNKQAKIVVNDRFTIEPQGYCLAQQLTILR